MNVHAAEVLLHFISFTKYKFRDTGTIFRIYSGLCCSHLCFFIEQAGFVHSGGCYTFIMWFTIRDNDFEPYVSVQYESQNIAQYNDNLETLFVYVLFFLFQIG